MKRNKNKVHQSSILLWAEKEAYFEKQKRFENEYCMRRGCGRTRYFHMHYHPLASACPEFLERSLI